MDKEPTICPWCHTEIVWDEELGPEQYCPHCENELAGYRTLSLGLDGEDEYEEEEEVEQPSLLEAEIEEEEEEEDESAGFHQTDSRMLAIEQRMVQILDRQEEVPECPACREYMLETGRQQVGGDSYKPTVHEGIRQALVPAPFTLVWYVCPSCFQMQNRLAASDRDELIIRLSTAE